MDKTVIIIVRFSHSDIEYEVTLRIPPSATEGEVLDAISRNTCAAYQVLAKRLDTSPTK